MNAGPAHHWVSSDGVRLAYRELGAGRPVLLVHGLFSDSVTNWIKFGTAGRIAARGFRVIMPDLRAHGASDAPHDPAAYPPGRLAGDLSELVAHLDLKPGEFDLGGFSLGARTTVQAVGEGLTPRRAVIGGMGYEGLAGWLRRKDFFVDTIDRFDEVRHGDPAFFAVQFMKAQNVDRVAAQSLLDSFRDAELNWLDRFTMPTLVVCGLEDHDNGSAEQLAVALPDGVYEAVPGTHMSSVTRPEFGETIAAFLAKP